MNEYTNAGGQDSVALGFYSNASAQRSMAVGDHTTAPSLAQLSVGAYNKNTGSENATAWVLTDPIFSVGNGTSGSTSTALMVLKNGNVGIATTAPSAAFEVAATGTTSAILIPRDTTANRPTGINGMFRYNTTANAFEFFQNNIWVSYITGSAGSTSFPLLASPGTTAPGTPSYSFSGNANTGLFSPATNQVAIATAGTTALTINSLGYVGIGSTVPTQALDVVGNAQVSGNILLKSSNSQLTAWGGAFGLQPSTANSNGYFAFLPSGTNTQASINIVGSSNYGVTSYTALTQNGVNASFLNQSPTGNLSLGSNNTTQISMTPSGLVGIGTSSPLAALDVSATGTTSAMLVPRDITANRPTGINGMLRYNTTANSFEFFQNNAWVSYNTGSAGALSFPLLASPATASPGAPSYSFSGNANTGLFSPATNQVALSTAGTTALTILGNGNVGIGTSAPANTLHIFQPNNSDLNAEIQNTNSGKGSNLLVYANSFYAATEYQGTSGDWKLGLIGSSSFSLFDATTGFYPLRIENSAPDSSFVVKASGNVGIGTSTPAVALDISAFGPQSAVRIPQDTTANRPTGANGMMRYNTTTAAFEFYQAGTWTGLGAAGGGSSLTCPSGFTAMTSMGTPFCINTTSWDNAGGAALNPTGAMISNCAGQGGMVCSFAQLYSANAAGLIHLSSTSGVGATYNGSGAWTAETMFYPDAFNYNSNGNCPSINGSGAFAGTQCGQKRSFFCCR